MASVHGEPTLPKQLGIVKNKQRTYAAGKLGFEVFDDFALMAAVAGAVGAGLGMVVAWGLEKTLKRRPQWLTYLPVVFVAATVGLAQGLQPAFAADVTTAVDTAPAVQSLKTYYPEEYRRLATEIRAASGAPDRVRAAVAAAVGGVVFRQRPKADAEASYALYEVARLEGGLLKPSDPEGCAAFMDGKGAPGLGKVLTDEVRTKDEAATQRLLAQTATHPAAPATPMVMDDLVKLSSEALSTLPEAEQDLAISVLQSEKDPATPEENRAMCDFHLALADTILSRPPAVAGTIIRSLWAIR